MKVAVFNVGGALSVYVEYSGKSILLDIGNNKDFSPTHDFLLPLYQKRKANKINNKYQIDQLIISHPHNDHISDLINFNEYFHPALVTCPNDNDGMAETDKINWDLITNPNDIYVKFLRKNVLPGRKPPLISCHPHLSLFWIPPKTSEECDDLNKVNYSNNISLVCYIYFNNNSILLPGDIMKDGMAWLINNSNSFKNTLAKGIDFLIAPHHGLKTSFSTELFNCIPNNKIKRLNIVSEKTVTEDSNRVVDSRYSNSYYCEGRNNLSTPESIVCQRKTSSGHILLDFNNSIMPRVNILDTNQLIAAY